LRGWAQKANIGTPEKYLLMWKEDAADDSCGAEQRHGKVPRRPIGAAERQSPHCGIDCHITETMLT
jgi:hypothetical protein